MKSRLELSVFELFAFMVFESFGYVEDCVSILNPLGEETAFARQCLANGPPPLSRRERGFIWGAGTYHVPRIPSVTVRPLSAIQWIRSR